MEEVLQWIVVAAFWLISAAVRKARQKTPEASTPPSEYQAPGIDPRPEQRQVAELAKHVEEVKAWLTTLPAEAQWSLPLFEEVVEAEVTKLVWQTEMFVQEPTMASLTLVQRQRYQLAQLVHILREEAHDWARGAQPEIWVGQALLDAIPSLHTELIDLVGAQPNIHVLEDRQLTPDELLHVYAAWIPQIFSDVVTAALTPKRAQLALKAIEQAQGIHRTHSNVTPLILRGHVLAARLGLSFHPMQMGNDLVIQLASGEYALPARTIIQDITRWANTIANRSWDGLGNQSPMALVHTIAPPNAVSEKRQEQITEMVTSHPKESEEPQTFQWGVSRENHANKTRFRKRVRDALILDEVYRI